MSEEQKVVLVTGGSSGIGQATALEYAKLGYKVAVTGRSEERLKSTLEELEKISEASNFLTLRADFEDPKQVEDIVQKTVNKFNRLDILINNAGYAGERRNFMHPEFFEDFQKILQVNLLAATRIAQLAVPELLKTKGVIINVSSVADRMPTPSVSYSVSKAGLTMLTKTLANALDGKQVRVVTVAPGPIFTNFNTRTSGYEPVTSLGRIGEAPEVAQTIVFLTSEKASYIHGCTIDVDGGCAAKYGNIFGLAKLNKEASTESK